MKAETEQTLSAIFREVLNLAPGQIEEEVRQEQTSAWDSLAHVMLIGAMESEFGLSIDAGSSLELTSYKAAARFLESHGL